MTYEIQIPENPADKGITTLEATDVNGKARTLKWIVNENSEGAWYALNLITGKPSKTGHSWRNVLAAYKGVREPADPAEDVKREIAAELTEALQAYEAAWLDEKTNSDNPAGGAAGEGLAADLRNVIARLDK